MVLVDNPAIILKRRADRRLLRTLLAVVGRLMSLLNPEFCSLKSPLTARNP